MELRNAYGMTAPGSATIAIVDAFGYAGRREGPGDRSSAVRVDALYVCCRLLSKAQSSGTAVPSAGGQYSWSQETALDLDMASAICPGCNLLLVEANPPTV